MIDWKRHCIATGFILLLPLNSWAEAPVVDDSANFAIIDGQQADSSSVAANDYDEPATEGLSVELAENNAEPLSDSMMGDEPALAKADANSPDSTSSNAGIIEKMQNLQKEVQELRGQVEVQAHDLKLLQQQQLAFYKDIDSRLGSGTHSDTAQSTPLDIDSKSTQSADASSVQSQQRARSMEKNTTISRANPADEQISYLAAFELVKNKQFDKAIMAMNGFVSKYPQGGYTANAYYWLGELYLVKKDYSQSIKNFETVLHDYPSSSKTAASLLKVGYAYADTGHLTEAKRRLQQVVANYPNSQTAQLAQNKLDSMSTL